MGDFTTAGEVESVTAHEVINRNAPMVIGIFLLGSVQLFFIGLLGEYILNINTRVIHRPLVVEEKRLNFEETGSSRPDFKNMEETRERMPGRDT